MKWESVADHDLETQEYNSIFNRNRGIVLALGFLPGFKVDAISLLRPNKVNMSNIYNANMDVSIL